MAVFRCFVFCVFFKGYGTVVDFDCIVSLPWRTCIASFDWCPRYRLLYVRLDMLTSLTKFLLALLLTTSVFVHCFDNFLIESKRILFDHTPYRLQELLCVWDKCSSALLLLTNQCMVWISPCCDLIIMCRLNTSSTMWINNYIITKHTLDHPNYNITQLLVLMTVSGLLVTLIW